MTGASISDQAKTNFRSLEVLRGLAALYVVVNHARGNLFMGGKQLLQSTGADASVFDYVSVLLAQFTALGTEAVVLFFVLSGFSITHSVRRSQGQIGRYYLRRLLRIYPPYLFALLVAVVLSALIVQFSSADQFTVPAQETYLEWFSFTQIALYLKSGSFMTAQFWSLVFEILFYLIAPFMLATRKTTIAAFFVIGACFFGSILVTDGKFVVTDAILQTFIFHILFYFLVGALLYEFWERIPLYLTPRVLAGVCLIGFVLIVGLKHLQGGSTKLTGVATVALSLPIIKAICRHEFRNRFLLFLGEISYSLYLLHFAVIVMIRIGLYEFFDLEQKDIGHHLLWIAAVPLCVAFSRLGYLAVEQRCNGYVSRLRRPA